METTTAVTKKPNLKTIRKQVRLMMNLAEAAWDVGNRIAEEVGDDDFLYELLTRVQERSMTDEYEFMDSLKHIIGEGGETDEEEAGRPESCAVPKICTTENPDSMEVHAPVDGGELILYLGEMDYGTRQAGIMYKADGEVPIDIALAEIKRGELAEINQNHEMPADNKDIEVMVWADPWQEGYTEGPFLIRYDDIVEAIHD